MSDESVANVAASERRIEWALPILTFIALVGAIIPMPVQLPADGHEYLGAVASLIATHNLTYEREDMIASARMSSPETFYIDGDVGQNTVVNPWTGKRIWGSHTIYIAFAALPWVLLFGAKGFLVLNAACFALMMHFLYRHFRDANSATVALGLSVFGLILSGALNYVFWVNSEMLLMAMLFGALYYGLRFQMYRAMVFLGVATAIKPPIAMLFFLLTVWHFANHRSIRVIFVMGLVYFAALLPHLAYDLAAVGRLGLFRFGNQGTSVGGVSKSGAGILRYVTWLRVWTFWFGSGTGTIWFYPAIIWCLFRTRFPRWMTVAVLVTAAALSVTCLVPDNLISTGAGIRYSTLVFPLLLFLGGTWRSRRLDWALVGIVAFLGAPLAIDAVQNTRTPEAVFGRPYPSMIPAEYCGAPLYPELLFHVGARQPRGVVADYVDNQSFVRNKSVQAMIRDAEPGEAVFVMLPAPDAQPSTVQFGLLGESRQSRDLVAGQMATLSVPMVASDFVDVAYPEWRGREKHSGPTARFEFQFSHLDVASSVGELQWQQRYHGGNFSFLHLTGPRILNVFPSRDWILDTVSVEEFEDARSQPAQAVLASDTPNVFINWDSQDKMEGGVSIRVIVPPDVPSPQTRVFTAGLIDVSHPCKEGLREVEAGGFVRVESIRSHPKAQGPPRIGMFMDVLDANDRKIQHAWIVPVHEEPGNQWRYFTGRAALPEGAVSARVGVVLVDAVGSLKIDGLVVSWYQTPWQ